MARNIYGRPMFNGGTIRTAPRRFQEGTEVVANSFEFSQPTNTEEIVEDVETYIEGTAGNQYVREKLKELGRDLWLLQIDKDRGYDVQARLRSMAKDGSLDTAKRYYPKQVEVLMQPTISEWIISTKGKIPEFIREQLTPTGRSFDPEAARQAKRILNPVRRQAGGGIEAVMPGDLGALVEQPPMPIAAPPPIEEALPRVEQAAANVAEEEVGNYAANMMSGLDAAEESGDPEDAINALRGNELPISERYEELATYVGDDDAERTPESVLLMVQPTIMLTEQGAMDSGIGSLMQNLVGEVEMETDVGTPTPMGEGVGSLMMAQADTGVGQEPPVNFNYGGPVQRFSNGREVKRYTVPPYLVGKQPNVNITRSQVPDDNTLMNKYLREQFPHIAEIIINQQAVSETIPNPTNLSEVITGADAYNFGLKPNNKDVSNNNKDVSNNNKDGTKRPSNLSEVITSADATNFGLEPKKEAPTLKELAEARANLYKDILGTEDQEKLDKEELEESKKLAQAQVFFDIAQGGLALAAGDPTLSFAENVARAAAPVVGKISERSAEFTKEKRALDKARRAQEQAIKLKSVDAVIKQNAESAAALTEFQREVFLEKVKEGLLTTKQMGLMVTPQADIYRIESGFNYGPWKRNTKGSFENTQPTLDILRGAKRDEIPGGAFTLSLAKLLRNIGNIFGLKEGSQQLKSLNNLENSMKQKYILFQTLSPGVSSREAGVTEAELSNWAKVVPAYASSNVFSPESIDNQLERARILHNDIKQRTLNIGDTINKLAQAGKTTGDVYTRSAQQYTIGKQLIGQLQSYIRFMGDDPQPPMKSSGRAATNTSDELNAFDRRLRGGN